MLIISPQLRIPLREFQFTFARSGGPGGQNVNKVSSKATLRWPVLQSLSLPGPVRTRLLEKIGPRLTATGDLLVTSQRFRDAGRNVADCLEKLRARSGGGGKACAKETPHPAYPGLGPTAAGYEAAALAGQRAAAAGHPLGWVNSATRGASAGGTREETRNGRGWTPIGADGNEMDHLR